MMKTCKYCNSKINDSTYDLNDGLCGKCKNVDDWKSVLKYKKSFEK